jgi:NAD(P)-dependent dehydrogenase (short-subunit alcohol dehydrogenase family)
MAAIGQPDEMVGICVYLASDAASYTSGALIEVARPDGVLPQGLIAGIDWGLVQ